MTDILTFYMVRHAEVFNPDRIWYGREIPYDVTSERALQRFNRLAQILPTDPANTIWLSSDYPRAIATAKGILNAVTHDNVPEIILDRRFVEQQYGIMEGMIGSEAIKHPELVPYFEDLWNNAPPGGESMQMFQGRVGRALNEVIDATASHIQNIVINAHGGTNMAAWVHAKGQKMSDVFKARGKDMVPSFSFISSLKLSYDRNAGKWLEAVEYESGLPKLAL